MSVLVEDGSMRDGETQCSRTEEQSSQTFFALAATRLEALTTVAGFSEQERGAATVVLKDVLAPWGRWRIGRVPRVASDIGDDGFPIEFSVALRGHEVEARVLLEVQTPHGSMMERWAAGLALNDRLEHRHGLCLERVRLLEDLFVPEAPEARYAIWHSFCLRRARRPAFKVYLNPQAQRRERAPQVIVEALRRLGFPRSLWSLWEVPRARRELKFFSLDLGTEGDARVKIYDVHHGATTEDLHGALSAARGYDRRLLSAFVRAVAGSDGPFLGRPPSTYLSLTSWREAPSGGTIHFPIRDYVDDDSTAFDRIRQFLDGEQRARYEAIVAAFARRRLHAGVGMHSYVSLAFDHTGSRVTVYFSPEGYEVAPPRAPQHGARE